MKHNLEVYREGTLIFFSDAHWLYPLFELEAFLRDTTICAADLFVKDKIIGRAAALLLVRLGIKEVRGELMSKLASEALDRYGVYYTYKKLVDRIICATEDILKEEFDPERAYTILKMRAGC